MNAPVMKTAAFWDRIAPGYAKKPVADEEAYRLTLERVAHHLPPQARVLELACGTGTTALKLAGSAGEIVATDISPKMLSIAREKARDAAVENVSFLEGSIDDGTLPDWQKPFDVVMAFNFFHLVPDPAATFSRILQLLKPGGLFISKTPCIGEYSVFLRAALPLMRAVGRAPYVNPVTKVGIESATLSAGFSIIERGLYPQKSHALFLVARAQ